MLIFGHLGIGKRLARPWSSNLPSLPLYIGMLLPDLIDKPLYYANLHLKNRQLPYWKLITCTRTIGHSSLCLGLLLLGAGLLRSRLFRALSLGVATHVFLDCMMDYAGLHLLHSSSTEEVSSALTALEWPELSSSFSVFWFESVADQARHWMTLPTLVTESVGLLLLLNPRKLHKKPNRADQ